MCNQFKQTDIQKTWLGISVLLQSTAWSFTARHAVKWSGALRQYLGALSAIIIVYFSHWGSAVRCLSAHGSKFFGVALELGVVNVIG